MIEKTDYIPVEIVGIPNIFIDWLFHISSSSQILNSFNPDCSLFIKSYFRKVKLLHASIFNKLKKKELYSETSLSYPMFSSDTCFGSHCFPYLKCPSYIFQFLPFTSSKCSLIRLMNFPWTIISKTDPLFLLCFTECGLYPTFFNMFKLANSPKLFSYYLNRFEISKQLTDL